MNGINKQNILHSEYVNYLHKHKSEPFVMLDEMIETMAISLTDRIMIKIDVEGMEKDVLLGAKEFMKKYSDIILVIESVHSGEQELKSILDQMAVFEYIKVDKLNFAAKKINNL